jgi:peroxiredoxin family protein
MGESAMKHKLGVMLVSGAHDRAHAAISLAAAAAALGRPVVMFATSRGSRALLDDWSALDDAGHDAVLRYRGVAGFGVLREHARELGVRFIVCETGLKGEALDDAALAEGVEVAGLATFLDAVGDGQIASI